MLAELGDTIAHAVHAAETRTALRDRETQLDRERDLLDRILETVPVGLVVLEPSGVITRCNDQGADILDMSCEAVEGATYREAEWTFVEEDGDPVSPSEHPFTRVRDEGAIHGVELRMDRPHADPVWLSINGASVDGDASTDDRFVFTFEDVTEERRIRNDLRRTNETLEAMVEAAPVAVVTHEIDGTVTRWNPAAEALFGWSEDEVLGEPLPPFVTDDDRASFEANCERLLDGESIDGVEVTRQTRDGEERDLYLSAAPIRSLDGEINGIVGILVDITEQKRREQVLETLHDATRGLMTASTPAEIAEITAETAKGVLGYPVNVVRLTSDDGNHLQPVAVTSEARMRLGERPTYGVDEGLPGRAFARGELVVADERTDPELSLPGDGESTAMYVPMGEFGTLSILDTSGDGFPDTDRHLAEILVANAEAALDRVEREQEVERQNERLDEFASLVSHDLRNPLNVAAGRVELAREERDGEHLAAAADALGRMERLIEDMLSLAREGRTVGSPEPVALRQLLADCWRNVDTRDADLVVETDLTIEADTSRLRSLVENLFRNAVEHAGPDVTVRVTPLDDGQGFAIEDDGPGIPEADREAVFEPGFSTAAEGTGFGLAIVRQVAEAHGWTVTATESADGGARFEVAGVGIGVEETPA
ncbi:PAS domain S-box protein [Halobacteriaceae archaeon GCM10025711]